MDTGHAALRRGRFSATGQTYLVTFVTAGRRMHFASASVAQDACRELANPLLWQRSRLLAWVLMPDHWHGLVEVGAFDALAACVGRLKGRTARHLRLRHGALDKVLAAGYHDRAIRRDEDLVVAARYLVMNPVRAGLVARVGDYPYWDAVWV